MSEYTGMVTVTREDIKCGIACNSHRCPVTLALSRRFPNALDLYTHHTRAYMLLSDREGYLSSPLSKRTTDFIYAFDGLTKGGRTEIKPFKFKVRFS